MTAIVHGFFITSCFAIYKEIGMTTIGFSRQKRRLHEVNFNGINPLQNDDHEAGIASNHHESEW